MAATIERTTGHPVEAPLTLAEPAAKALGFVDQLALGGNLGISLLLPGAAAFVVQPFRFPALSIAAALAATVVGAVLGSTVLGLSAVPGARLGVPAMVLLRGLFGRRGSAVPTVLNLLQCLGWATFEVVVIGESAARLTSEVLRPLYVVLAGVAATGMALRPLRVVRTLRRYAAWLVLAATAYLLIAVLREPLPPLAAGSWRGFWPAADVVVAMAVSWAPLAADYSRHSRTGAAAFGGALVGYAAAAIAYFGLGVLALATIVGTGDDVLASLLAVPAGAVALAILAVDEVDEAFANVYSTAVSAQNLAPRVDRRVLAVVTGGLAVALALVADIMAYESFLLLIGSVFVPLFAVALVDFFLVRRGRWDVSESARGRWPLVLPWAAGFAAYQLVNPGTVGWWSRWWTDAAQAVRFAPQAWMSASLLSFAVAGLLTLLVGRLDPRRVSASGVTVGRDGDSTVSSLATVDASDGAQGP